MDDRGMRLAPISEARDRKSNRRHGLSEAIRSIPVGHALFVSPKEEESLDHLGLQIRSTVRLVRQGLRVSIDREKNGFWIYDPLEVPSSDEDAPASTEDAEDTEDELE